jgi:hypothetical protein
MQNINPDKELLKHKFWHYPEKNLPLYLQMRLLKLAYQNFVQLCGDFTTISIKIK